MSTGVGQEAGSAFDLAACAPPETLTPRDVPKIRPWRFRNFWFDRSYTTDGCFSAAA
jgi:hypothetical protein